MSIPPFLYFAQVINILMKLEVKFYMLDLKDSSPKMVENEHKSEKSDIRIGKCPVCHVPVSYRGKKTTHCLCCGNPIEWDI